MSLVFDGPPQLGPALGFPNPFAYLDKSGAWSGPPLHRQLLSKSAAHEQVDCPLFQLCPAEIRSQIFSLVLLDYEDPAEAKQYSKHTCWTHRYGASTNLQINLQRNLVPSIQAQRTDALDHQPGPRAPPEYRVNKARKGLRETVDGIKREHEEQVCGLESVADFLEQFPDLAFQRLYITIRHTDFWFWETDEPLRFECQWIPGLCRVLPTTVREVVIEMETVRRKATQLDDIANQMAQRWHFRTKDGKALFADSTANSHKVSCWQGSSCWHKRRWIRDEISRGIIAYHVGAVRFRPRYVVEQVGGTISDEASKAAQQEEVVPCPRMELHLPNARPMQCDRPSVRHRIKN
ncbi:hypothetical protein LLEC1_04022 [Akanthomyces lecanii]|uniref:Uncharacterized protein n=1 Tax=Cordyceps confragosa TaxID=2714763 RepID=A0A179IEM0_CORDF|nr:hypothetical protein LLEC1_04022 [Akanthomyces lecanii]